MSRAGEGRDRRRILAMGGGGFTMGERSPALDRFVLELTGKPVPKICFLPTASGDERAQVVRFYERFSPWPCEPSALSLFHLGRDRIDPGRHLLAQDAIYAGGGSMRNMLAIWREHGLDQVMRTAWPPVSEKWAGRRAIRASWRRGKVRYSHTNTNAPPGGNLSSLGLASSGTIAGEEPVALGGGPQLAGVGKNPSTKRCVGWATRCDLSRKADAPK